MAGNDDDPLRIGGISRPTGPAAVDAPGPTDAAGAIDGVSAPGLDAITSVTASLDAGAIDGEAALQSLIDAAATQALGPGADAAAVDAIRAEVASLLAGDPTLAALLRR